MAGPIKISILANARPAIQEMKQVEKASTGMGSKLGGVGRGIKTAFVGMGAAVAAAGIAEGFKAVVDEAASLTAAIGTTKTIFGTSAKGMLDWSKTAATTLGLSQSEALNATKVFGGFFTGVGMGSQKAADMSKNWTTMAANMAAFGDIPVADSLEAVKSALIGEYDPIQKLIPTLSAATLEQKAMELSGKKNAKSLTAQDKAAALNAIMMDSMANKVGEAERKQGGYAVQMDKLKAQMKDAAGAIGRTFLPALTKGMDFINTKAFPAVKKFGEFVGPKLKGAFDALKGFKPPKAAVDLAGSKETMSIFTNMKTGLTTLAPMFGKVKAAVMPIVTAIAGTLGKAFNKALPQIKATIGTIGEIVGQIFETIKATIQTWINVVQFVWQNFGTNILAYISSAFAGVVTVIQGVFNVIKGIFNVVIGILTGDWGKAWEGVKGIISGAWGVIKGIFGIIKAGVTLLMSAIGKIFSMGWNAVKAAAVAVWNAIKAMLVAVWNGIKAAIMAAVSGIGSALAAAWNGIKAGVSAAWNAIKAVTSAVWNGIKAVIGAVWGGIKSAVTSAVSTVKSTISSAWNAVKTAATTAWNGIKTAVSTGIGKVVTTVKGLPGKIKGALTGAATWLVDTGRNAIQGMIKGITDMAGELANKAKNVVKGAIDAAKAVLRPGSPSKEFEMLGIMSALGYMEGWDITADNLKNTVSGIVSDVIDVFGKTITAKFPKGTKLSVIDKWKKAEQAAAKVRTKMKSALIARIEKDNLKLVHLIDQRDAAAEGLKAANDRLAELQQARASAVTSIAGAFEQNFKLINDAGDEGVATIDDMLARSRDSVSQAKQFADHLAALATRGVDPEILQELAMAGPRAGLETAQALAQASADQVAELNENYKLIAATGKAAGETVASSMYDAGIATAQSLAAGFAAEQAYLESTIQGIVQALTATVSAAVAAMDAEIKAAQANADKTVAAAAEAAKKAAAAKKTTAAAKKTAAKAPAKKAAPKKAVPAATAAKPVTVTINTGVVVDKRGMVDAISSAFNEVSGQLGRPISMNVRT